MSHSKKTELSKQSKYLELHARKLPVSFALVIIADVALMKLWGKNVMIQAFVDDFILILRGKTKKYLIDLSKK